MKMRMCFFLMVFAAGAAFAEYVDPVRPFGDYTAAMSRHEGYEMAADWQKEAGDAIAAGVAEDALADAVADEAAAAALLAEVKGAWATDPLVATKIAAVSQWVMGEEPCWLFFWKPSPAEGRKVWIGALLTRAETADDPTVALFCLDQLRWCGCDCPCVIRRLTALRASKEASVRDFAGWLLRELSGKAIGR